MPKKKAAARVAAAARGRDDAHKVRAAEKASALHSAAPVAAKGPATRSVSGVQGARVKAIRNLASPEQCTRLSADIRAAISAFAAAGRLRPPRKTGSHAGGLGLGSTQPQHGAFQAARGWNASSTGGATNIFGASSELARSLLLDGLASGGADLAQRRALAKRHASSFKPLWNERGDGAANGVELVGFDSAFPPVKDAPPRKAAKPQMHTDKHDVTDVYSIVLYLKADRMGSFYVWPGSAGRSAKWTRDNITPIALELRAGDAVFFNSRDFHMGAISKAMNGKEAVVFYCTEQDRLRPLVMDAWSPEFQAMGTYMEAVHKPAVDWHALKARGIRVPAVLKPEHAEVLSRKLAKAIAAGRKPAGVAKKGKK